MCSNEETLVTAAASAERVEAWHRYVAYCRLRARGLRRHAFNQLEAFLRETDRWRLEERQSFVSWLCGRMSAGADPRSGLLPYPLFSRLLRPTLMQWTQVEPHDPRPHRWLGMFLRYGNPSEMDVALADASLKRAIELDPDEQLARIQLADDLLADLWYSAHHLPEVYLGDPSVDCARASEVDRLARAVRNEQKRRFLRDEANRYRQLADNWAEFQADGGQDFERWCVERGRVFHDF